MVDTKTAIPDLSPEEADAFNKALSEAKGTTQPDADKRRDKWINENAPKIAEKAGIPENKVREAMKQSHGGVLLPEMPLVFDDPSIGTVTAADIAKDPDRFIGETLADPLDGIEYGPCKAKVMGMSNKSGDIIINSVAHGLSKSYRINPETKGPQVNGSGQQNKAGLPAKGEGGPTKGEKRARDGMIFKITTALASVGDESLTEKVLTEIKDGVVSAMITQVMRSQKDNHYWLMNKDGTLSRFSGKEVWPAMVETFGTPISRKEVEALLMTVIPPENADQQKLLKDTVNTITGAVRFSIMDEIKIYQQRPVIAWHVDMFANRHRMILRENDALFILPHVRWKEGPIDWDVVNDFRQHMPMIDNLLAVMVDARFAGDRKKAFVWWMASSDFGKGLVTSLLKHIGALVEVSVSQIEKVMDGSPVGVGAEEFRRAIILHIDEWDTVRAELKRLQSEMEISPKHQMRQRVPLYLKLFTSADEVPSLATTEGVEDQFANRMSLITNEGSIESREMFHKVGKSAYARSLRNWFAKRLNDLTDTYIKKGRAQSQHDADEALTAFHNQHGIGKKKGTVGERIVEIAAHFREDMLAPRRQRDEWQEELDMITQVQRDETKERNERVMDLINAGREGEAKILESRPVLSQAILKKRDILQRKIIDFTDDRTEDGIGGSVILRKPRAALDAWIRKSFTASERPTILARIPDILKHVDVNQSEAKSYKVTGQTGVVWGLKIKERN